MRISRIRDALSVAAVLVGCAGATNAQDVVRLSDAQLDAYTAGASATASGDGLAIGRLSADTRVSVASAVGSPSPGNGFAVGEVTAAASSPAAGPSAIASSSLTLSLTLP
jgi:cytochrome c biogenesis protein CcdA